MKGEPSVHTATKFRRSTSCLKKQRPNQYTARIKPSIGMTFTKSSLLIPATINEYIMDNTNCDIDFKPAENQQKDKYSLFLSPFVKAGWK
jgi:hypothetical protein